MNIRPGKCWKIIVPFLIILTGCGLISKSGKISQKLNGYWMLYDIIYEDINKEMNENVKKNINEMIPGSYLEFKNKNKFEYNIDQYSGTNRWKLIGKKDEIVFDTLFLIPKMHAEIRKLNNDTLYLRVPSGDMKVVLEFIKLKR
jgi:hypothetical protein